MAEIAAAAPDSVAEGFSLARLTSEGRRIDGLRLGVPNNASKPAIVIEAGMHSREWIGSVLQ